MLIQIKGDFLTKLSAIDGIPPYLNIFIGITLIVVIVFAIKRIWKIRKNKEIIISDSQPNPIVKYPPRIISKHEIPTEEGIRESDNRNISSKKSELPPPAITITRESKPDLKPITPIAKTLKPEKEEQTKEKYIGYNPINIFAQTEPLNFPYVIMPKPGNVIKFPRKSRLGRKGFKEEDFKTYIIKYFSTNFQVFDDRFILVKNVSNPYEPDFTLIDEKAGLNLFIDVEIDEPYEGLNDISKRRATHFQNFDTNRNNAFKNRGWVVVRFAEIQVHQQPDVCCRFLSDVIKSISPSFNIHVDLARVKQIQPVKQWTKEEAAIWSKEKYREKYLGITSFGITSIDQTLDPALETELGEQIEEQVDDDVQELILPMPPTQNAVDPKLSQIMSAFQLQKFLSFSYVGRPTIAKPVSKTITHITAYCYVKNAERTFAINEMSGVNVKDNYFTVRVAGPTIGLSNISNAVNTAINYQKHIRMKYTRIAWSNILVDKETGELILNKVDAEESVRTINNVQLSINALSSEHISAYRLDNNYITAYCNKREEQRTFRFDRIGEIEILDI